MSKRGNNPELSESEIVEITQAFKQVIKDSDFVLAVDFEATCCDDNSFPRRESEIIEFGCALVDVKQRKVVDTFSSFVKPQVHPVLHRFCTELTTIVQEQVDTAPVFKQVVKQVNDWLHEKVRIGNKSLVWISWGQYDFNKLIEDCARARVNNPLGGNSHFNFKRYEALLSRSREKGLDGVIKHYGLQWYGVHHRGVDDAVNVANLFLHITEKW